jgi:uncharacterized protein (DUF433 family)
MPRRRTKRKVLGRYIVADPNICHGKPTFLGSRVMVWQVLELVAEERPWDEIIEHWPRAVCREAIAEAIGLASRMFLAKARVYPKDYEPPEGVPDESYPWPDM